MRGEKVSAGSKKKNEGTDREKRQRKREGKGAVSVLILFFLFPAASFGGEPLWTVSLKSQEVFQGGVVKIIVSERAVTKVKGLFLSREIPFFGVNFEERPGSEKITIKGWNKSGKVRERLITIRIKKDLSPRGDSRLCCF